MQGLLGRLATDESQSLDQLLAHPRIPLGVQELDQHGLVAGDEHRFDQASLDLGVGLRRVHLTQLRGSPHDSQ